MHIFQTAESTSALYQARISRIGSRPHSPRNRRVISKRKERKNEIEDSPTSATHIRNIHTKQQQQQQQRRRQQAHAYA